MKFYAVIVPCLPFCQLCHYGFSCRFPNSCSGPAVRQGLFFFFPFLILFWEDKLNLALTLYVFKSVTQSGILHLINPDYNFNWENLKLLNKFRHFLVALRLSLSSCKYDRGMESTFSVRQVSNTGHLRNINHTLAYVNTETELTLWNIIKRHGGLENFLTLACPR